MGNRLRKDFRAAGKAPRLYNPLKAKLAANVSRWCVLDTKNQPTYTKRAWRIGMSRKRAWQAKVELQVHFNEGRTLLIGHKNTIGYHKCSMLWSFNILSHNNLRAPCLHIRPLPWVLIPVVCKLWLQHRNSLANWCLQWPSFWIPEFPSSPTKPQQTTTTKGNTRTDSCYNSFFV